MVTFKLLTNKQPQYSLHCLHRDTLDPRHHSQYFITLSHEAKLVQLLQPFVTTNQQNNERQKCFTNFLYSKKLQLLLIRCPTPLLSLQQLRLQLQQQLLQHRTHIDQLLINTVYYSGAISNYIMQDNSELQVSLHDLKQLQKDPSIAPKMHSKLKYLQSSILNQNIDNNLLSELPEFERLSLVQTSRKEQVSLFINLVKCLANKNNITYFSQLKASIKKEQTFSGWNACLLTCDTHQLIVYKKKQEKKVMYQFSLEMLWVSKIYREYRKRFVFGIAYEGVKYQIGFEEEPICSKTHGEILSLIRERRGVREKLKGANSSSKSTISETNQLQFQKQNGVFEYQFNEDQLIQCQQKDYLKGIQQKVSKLQLFDNSSYQLLKNIQNGRILQNKKQKLYKVCLLLEKITLQGILLKFIEMPQWNSNVESFKIINRIRNNTFLASLKLKKYNMLTYPRETNLILTYFHTCSCLTQQQSLRESQKKHYLLLQSINSEQNSSFGAVRMDLQMTIEFSFVEDSPNTTFLILQSNINFNSYEYFSYDREMNMQFFQDFSFFSNYCKQHLHSPDKDKGHTFDLNYCACQLKKRRKLSIESEVLPSVIIQQSQNQQQKGFKISALESVDVIQAIKKYNSNIRDEMFVNIIRHCHHEKYYLRSTFQQGIKKLKQGQLAVKSHRDYLLQEGRWKLSDHNLVFQDQEILKSQKGIIKMILKQIGSNLMAGKSIMNMSLPVEIFDDKSMLQAIANTMGFFPHFMAQAVKTTNLVEQMKYVVLSFLFMNSCFPNVQKPFNPIIGETFQGILGGIPIYFQQTFHHPPISSVFIKTEQFQAYGNFDIHVDLGFNSAYSKISSYFTVKIPKTKTQYAIKFFDVEMGGISFGQRVFRLAGKGFAFEKTNEMYCQIATGKQKKKLYQYNTKLKNSDLAGGIFRVTNTFAKKLMSIDSSKNFDGVKYDDVIQKYSQISGKWYGDVFFDNTPYKTLENGPFPAILQRPSILLPSDPIFRLDILHRKWKQWQKSNEQKEVLQNLQRKDRRLRQSFKK